MNAELPPRAWRIHCRMRPNPCGAGTTSACAENTTRVSIMRQILGNYLRVRGEYSKPPSTLIASTELPPRARRIQITISPPCAASGTTSACAENTAGGESGVFLQWNYLRVRGEYRPQNSMEHDILELPPRARRIPFSRSVSSLRSRTTSACAENTALVRYENSIVWNYLRVRGEYPSITKTHH